jgi:hypothetical protein
MPGRDPALRLTLPAVLGFALLSVLVVGIGGDFPLHDDWVHMHEVEVLHRESRYDGAPILTSTFIAQGLWGALFTRLFGLDYATLRLATLVLAAGGALAMAQAARTLGASRAVALLAAATFWFMPLVLPLAFTFNTDVPFAAVLLMGGWFALRSLDGLRWRDALAAVLLFWAAFFIRQHGAVVLGAYGLALLVAALAGTAFSRAFRVAVGAGLGAGALAAALWLTRGAANAEQLAWLDHLGNALTIDWLREATRYGWLGFSLTGLVAAPLALLRLAHPAPGARLRWMIAPVVGVMAVMGIATSQAVLPLGHDVLHDLGTGWRALTSDASPVSSPAPLQLGAGAWLVLTVLGAAAATLLLAEFAAVALRWLMGSDGRSLGTDARARQVLFLVLWAGLFFASLLPFLPRTADRYLIPVILPVCLLACIGLRPSGSRRAWAAAVALALAGAFGTLAGTQDYLAWNRARWQALEALLGTVPATRIDGGFEFNGVHTREAYRRLHGRSDDHRVGQRGFWVVEDQYAISFWPREGFTVAHRYPYFTWLGFTQRELLVLERTGAVPPNPPRDGGESWDARRR